MRRGRKKITDDVFGFEPRDPDDAAPATVLRAVRVDVDALDVAADGRRYDDGFVWDDVEHVELVFER